MSDGEMTGTVGWKGVTLYSFLHLIDYFFIYVIKKFMVFYGIIFPQNYFICFILFYRINNEGALEQFNGVVTFEKESIQQTRLTGIMKFKLLKINVCTRQSSSLETTYSSKNKH